MLVWIESLCLCKGLVMFAAIWLTTIQDLFYCSIPALVNQFTFIKAELFVRCLPALETGHRAKQQSGFPYIR